VHKDKENKVLILLQAQINSSIREGLALVTLNLDKIFNLRSVLIIGASDEEGTVGYALMKNFTDHGFEGKIYSVNIRKTEIHGLKTYAGELL
jgi:hypothetical protein